MECGNVRALVVFITMVLEKDCVGAKGCMSVSYPVSAVHALNSK